MHRPNSVALSIVFPLFAAGCADNARVETEEPGEVGANADDLDRNPGSGQQTLDVGYDLSQPRCDPMLSFEVFAITRGDGSSVQNADCSFAFDDGAVVNSCAGEHSFAEGARFHDVRVSVVDRDTKEFFVEMTRRFVQPSVEPVLSAQQIGCEFAIEVVASHNVSAFAIASVSPEENVRGEPFRNGQGTFRFDVTRAGIYEVTYFVEDERAIPICTARLTERVEVKDCHAPCDAALAQ